MSVPHYKSTLFSENGGREAIETIETIGTIASIITIASIKLNPPAAAIHTNLQCRSTISLKIMLKSTKFDKADGSE